jgi:hypothetical protein
LEPVRNLLHRGHRGPVVAEFLGHRDKECTLISPQQHVSSKNEARADVARRYCVSPDALGLQLRCHQKTPPEPFSADRESRAVAETEMSAGHCRSDRGRTVYRKNCASTGPGNGVGNRRRPGVTRCAKMDRCRSNACLDAPQDDASAFALRVACARKVARVSCVAYLLD